MCSYFNGIESVEVEHGAKHVLIKQVLNERGYQTLWADTLSAIINFTKAGCANTDAKCG